MDPTAPVNSSVLRLSLQMSPSFQNYPENRKPPGERLENARFDPGDEAGRVLVFDST